MPKGLPMVFLMTLIATSALLGCREQPDERVERVMQESLIRQAEQNRHIAEQSRTSTDAAKRVVEAETAARTEMVQLQREIVQRDTEGRQQLEELSREVHAGFQDERNAMDAQRAALESDRRQIAGERNRDPIVAQTIGIVAALLACMLPLILAAYVLYTVNRSTDDGGVSEVLINELVTGNSPFVGSGPPALPIEYSGHSRTSSEGDEPSVST